MDVEFDQKDSEGSPYSELFKGATRVEGKVKEYTVQDKVEHTIQHGYKVRFSLAHSAHIMTTLFGERLCYLLDKALTRSIIMGTYPPCRNKAHQRRRCHRSHQHIRQ